MIASGVVQERVIARRGRRSLAGSPALRRPRASRTRHRLPSLARKRWTLGRTGTVRSASSMLVRRRPHRRDPQREARDRSRVRGRCRFARAENGPPSSLVATVGSSSSCGPAARRRCPSVRRASAHRCRCRLRWLLAGCRRSGVLPERPAPQDCPNPATRCTHRVLAKMSQLRYGRGGAHAGKVSWCRGFGRREG